MQTSAMFEAIEETVRLSFFLECPVRKSICQCILLMFSLGQDWEDSPSGLLMIWCGLFD